ncbi:MAG TPA: DUF6458 family protein [Acidimicrobiia bacterium]|jgi:hypothetical protein
MGIGVSIFLIAAGAILAFAVNMPANGLDLGVVGVILMLLGGVGLLAAMVLWNDWHPGRRREVDLYDGLDAPDVVVDHRSRVVDDEPVIYDEYDHPPPYRDPVVRRRVTSRRSVTYER